MDTRKAPENTRRPSRFTFAAHKATTRPPATACCVLPSLGGERALGAPPSSPQPDLSVPVQAQVSCGMRRTSRIIIPFAFLALLLVLRVADPGILQQLRWLTFDTYQRLDPRPYDPNSPVKIIDIDDASLERLGQWPWPRILLARMVERLTQAGAATIAFDIVFAERDRSSPAQALELWPQTPEVIALRKSVAVLPENDQVFADSIAQAPVIAGFVLTRKKTEKSPQEKGTFAIAGDDPHPFVLGYEGAVVNLPQIEQAAPGNGAFNSTPEADLVIRHVPIVLRLGDKLYPSLSAEALRVAQGAKTYIIKASGASGTTAFGEQTGIDSIKIGQFEVKTDESGRVLLHYTYSQPARYIPAWKIFEDDFDPNLVAGQIVFVGTSAAGTFDLRATPLQEAVPGVEIHAQAVEQILTGDFLKRPAFAIGAEVLYILILGLTLIILLRFIGAVWSLVLGGLATVSVIASSWYAFVLHGWMLDPITPSLMVFFVFMSANVVSYLSSEAQRRFVRDAFGRYLSPVVVELLARNPGQLQLGGEQKTMTIMFSDIRGFTSISERFKQDPQGLTKLINRFLTPMTDVVLEQGGTIDKYMGDALMAFWNAPLDDKAHGVHACQAALRMFEALGRLNGEFRSELASGADSDTSPTRDSLFSTVRADKDAQPYEAPIIEEQPHQDLSSLLKEAEKGLAKAQYELGKAYRDSNQVNHDLVSAARWFRASAEQGYAKAQRHLGTCYARGHGVRVDKTAAIMWLTLAAEQGLVTAEMRLNEVLKSVSAEERNEGERRVRAWHPRSQTEQVLQLDIGIGISTGECLVGNLGSSRRFDYSALGDPVNLASRLESQTKTYGVGIIISEATRELVPDFATLELDFIAVKGKTEAIRMYALLGSSTFAKSDIFHKLNVAHMDMLQAYRAQKWQEARDLMQACTATYPHLERLYDLYRDRIGQYERNPPGENWDGVFIALTK